MKTRIRFLFLFLLIALSAVSCSLLFPEYPEVVSSSPAAGEKGVAQDQPVIITFNKKVDFQKCIGAFSLQPHMLGHFEQNDKQIKFTPMGKWANGTTYLINITQSCEDDKGVDLKEPFTSTFAIGSEITPPTLVTNRELMADVNPNCNDLGDILIANFGTNICYQKGGVRFSFEFSEPMDQTKTSSAFSISPSVSGSIQWSGNVMTFVPAEDLLQNTQYNVTISTQATDANGNAMTDPFQRYFTTFGESTAPTLTNIFTDLTTGAGACDANTDDTIFNLNAVNICTDNNGSGTGAKFRFVFSEAMKVAETIASFAISPSVAGNLTMQTGNTELVFTASEALLPDTQYKITISNTAQDISNNSLQQTYIDYFTTTNTNGYPVVNSIQLLTGTKANCDINAGVLTDILSVTVNNACESNPPGFNDVIVTFSEPMNRTLTEGAFSISPSVNGHFSWDGTSQIMTFVADEKFDYAQRYQITISTTAQDAQGQNLQSKIVKDFVVITNDTTVPQISNITLEQSGDGDSCPGGIPDDIVLAANGSTATNICRSNAIVVNFSEDMDQIVTQNAVTLSPSADFTFNWNTPQQLQINFIDGMDSDSNYTLTVSSSAKDLAGNTLDQDFLVSFKTENTSPEILAIGLESHVTCNLLNPTGAVSLPRYYDAGDATKGYCWWDKSQDKESFNMYLFKPGNNDCFIDSAQDNLVVIFTKPMNPLKTINAISVRKVGESTSIEIYSWNWDATNQMVTLVIGESTATCGGPGTLGPGSMDFGDDGNLGIANYPIYILEIDTTAEDSAGNSLSKIFSFAFEGDNSI